MIGPTLTTPRLKLRPPQADDWPAFAAFMASERAQFVGGPADIGKAWRAFGHVAGHWVLRGFGSFVFTRRDNDSALGLTGPWYPADWPEHEIGWTVWDPDAEGQGLAAEAAAHAREHAYTALGWTTAVSYIAPANARSIALAQRLGAVLDTAADAPDDTALVYRHPAPGTAA